MSSFLASRARHPLLQAWQERVHAHWRMGPEQRPNLEYFWFHALFGQLVKDNATAADLWGRTRKLTAEYRQPGPHHYMPYEEVLVRPPSPEFKRRVEETEEVPVLKLTIHDVKYDREGRDVLLQRDGTAFPGVKASESGFEYLMSRTLEKAESMQGGAQSLQCWKPAPGPFRHKYGLSIATQPMMPG